jgi:hypothetical protein
MRPFDPRRPPSSSWNHGLRPMTHRSHCKKTKICPSIPRCTRNRGLHGGAARKGEKNGFG